MSSGSTLSSDLGNPEICLQYYKATLGFAFFITRSVVCPRRVWKSGRDRIARSGWRITRTIICRIRIGGMPMSLAISVSPPSGFLDSVRLRRYPLIVRPLLDYGQFAPY